MRVLLLNYEYPPLAGGAGAASQALAHGLASRGVSVDVVAGGEHDARSTELLWDGKAEEEGLLTVYRVKSRASRNQEVGMGDAFRYLRAALPLVRRRLREEHYDVVHFFFSLPTGAMLPLLDLRGTPVVVSLRGCDVPGHDPTRRSLERVHHLLRPLTRWIWRRADRVVAVCESLGHQALRTCPGLLYSVIPNGVDLARFRPPLRRARSSDRVRCLAVSRLAEGKGLADLIRAVGVLERNRVDLEIVGAGPESARCGSWPPASASAIRSSSPSRRSRRRSPGSIARRTS